MSESYTTAYMNTRAMMYMRAWMQNSIGEVGLVDGPIMAEMHRRMQWAGIVKDGNDEGVSEMTDLGMYLVEKLFKQSFNFFPLQIIMDLWPVEWIEAASAQSHKLREMPSRHTIINWLAIFQLEFPLDDGLRQYVRDRVRADTNGLAWVSWPEAAHPFAQLPDQLVDWPELSVDFTRASDVAGDFDDGREMSRGDLAQYLSQHRNSREPSASDGETIDADDVDFSVFDEEIAAAKTEELDYPEPHAEKVPDDDGWNI